MPSSVRSTRLLGDAVDGVDEAHQTETLPDEEHVFLSC